MYITSFVALVSFVVAGFFPSSRPIDSSVLGASQTMEYQMAKDEFVVVVVREGDVTQAEAKKFARQRAAEMAFNNGFRYITIESEGKSQVMKTGESDPYYGNMYEEMIIERDFSRERLRERSIPEGGVYPAYRIVVKGHNKPGPRTIDVCNLTPCN